MSAVKCSCAGFLGNPVVSRCREFIDILDMFESFIYEEFLDRVDAWVANKKLSYCRETRAARRPSCYTQITFEMICNR